MDPATIIAILGGATALVVALGKLFAEVHSLNLRVDGRLTELLELTRRSSHAEGAAEATAVATTTAASLTSEPVLGPIPRLP